MSHNLNKSQIATSVWRFLLTGDKVYNQIKNKYVQEDENDNFLGLKTKHWLN